VKSAGRAVDPTYSRGIVGRYTASIARPAVQSAAAVVTGGASLAVQSKAQRADALKGFAIGAAAGTAAAGASAVAPRGSTTDRSGPTDRMFSPEGGGGGGGGGVSGPELLDEGGGGAGVKGPELLDEGGGAKPAAAGAGSTSRTLVIVGAVVAVLVVLALLFRRPRRA
jgi:hypothetical protein